MTGERCRAKRTAAARGTPLDVQGDAWTTLSSLLRISAHWGTHARPLQSANSAGEQRCTRVADHGSASCHFSAASTCSCLLLHAANGTSRVFVTAGSPSSLS